MPFFQRCGKMSRIIIACLSRVQTYFPHNSILYYTELKGLQRYIVTPHVWTKAAKSLQNKLSLQHARQFQTKPLDEQRNNNVHYVALTRTISTHVARQSDARETMRVRPARAAHPLSRDKGCGAARRGATRRVRMDKLLSRADTALGHLFWITWRHWRRVYCARLSLIRWLWRAGVPLQWRRAFCSML